MLPSLFHYPNQRCLNLFLRGVYVVYVAPQDLLDLISSFYQLISTCGIVFHYSNIADPNLNSNKLIKWCSFTHVVWSQIYPTSFQCRGVFVPCYAQHVSLGQEHSTKTSPLLDAYRPWTLGEILCRALNYLPLPNGLPLLFSVVFSLEDIITCIICDIIVFWWFVVFFSSKRWLEATWSTYILFCACLLSLSCFRCLLYIACLCVHIQFYIYFHIVLAIL